MTGGSRCSPISCGGIDERVLAAIDPDMAGEAPRERLFDVLFSRFEALAPHKQAIRNLGEAARRDPLLALELNRIVTGSMGWMLTAAGIPSTGRRGLVRAQGLALVWARVMRVWLDDDDAGPRPHHGRARQAPARGRAERDAARSARAESCAGRAAPGRSRRPRRLPTTGRPRRRTSLMSAGRAPSGSAFDDFLKVDIRVGTHRRGARRFRRRASRR